LAPPLSRGASAVAGLLQARVHDRLQRLLAHGLDHPGEDRQHGPVERADAAGVVQDEHALLHAVEHGLELLLLGGDGLDLGLDARGHVVDGPGQGDELPARQGVQPPAVVAVADGLGQGGHARERGGQLAREEIAQGHGHEQRQEHAEKHVADQGRTLLGERLEWPGQDQAALAAARRRASPGG
jgi:hypothetical protein